MISSDETRKVLFIGTVGFNDVGTYFPLALTSCKSIHYRFFIRKKEPMHPLFFRSWGKPTAAYWSSV